MHPLSWVANGGGRRARRVEKEEPLSNSDVIKQALQTLNEALAADWPTLTVSDAAKTWLLGQVWGESRFGSTPDWGTSNNWGAVTYHKKDGLFIEHQDHDANGKPVVYRFQAYVSQREAARGWLKVILRGAVPVALAGNSTTNLAGAMYANRYFTGTSGSAVQRIAAYAAMIDAGAALIRSQLARVDGQPDVSTVDGYQETLRLLGLYDGEVDGVAGPRTRASVVEFQAEHQLKADGIVGPATQEAMLTALATCA